MASKSPERKEKQNDGEDETGKGKDRHRRKAAQILVIITIIDSASLVLWAKSEDFIYPADYYVRWLAYCGLLVGCAFGVHKFLKLRRRKLKKRTSWIIWASWLVGCITLFFAKDLPQDLSRPLIAANDPFPHRSNGPQISRVGTNSVLFFFGGFLIASGSDAQPITIVLGREGVSGEFKYEPLIEVSVKGNRATVSGRFFDKDGKIIAVLRDNKPIINPYTSFDVQRPDDSTLIIHDQYDAEVFNIRFIRPQVFIFTGNIWSPDGAGAIVTASHVKFINGQANNAVFGGSGEVINGKLWIGLVGAGVG